MKTRALLLVVVMFFGAQLMSGCNNKRSPQPGDSLTGPTPDDEVPQDAKALQTKFLQSLNMAETEGGEPVDSSHANIAIRAYKAEMERRNISTTRPTTPINSQGDWMHVTYSVKFAGARLIKWLSDPHPGLDPNVPIHFKIAFGLGTREYFQAIGRSPGQKLNRVTVFIIPYTVSLTEKKDNNNKDDGTKGGNPVYDLGGLDP